MLKNRTFYSVVAIAWLFTANTWSKTSPNILVILSDDQLHNTIGYYGGNVYTPHIDRLARNGLVFNRAYVSSSVCSPARYSLLTGRYAGRNTSREFLQHFPPGDPLRIENVNINMEQDGKNLQTHLKEKGYVTGIVGKWHLGPHLNTKYNLNWNSFGMHSFPKDADPKYDAGVNAAMAANHQRWCEHLKTLGWDYAANIYGANLKELRSEALNTHNIDWTVAGAIDFLDQVGDQPFFLYFSTTLHHGPDPGLVKNGKLIYSVDADPQYTGEGHLASPLDVLPSRDDLKVRVMEAGKPYRTTYCTWLDAAVGALQQKVRNLGKERDTLIVYLGDHGIKRYGKSTLYQGGVHIPMIMNWPGQITPGTQTDSLVQNIDLAATFYDYAGIQVPLDYTIDGKSLRPLMEGDLDAKIHTSLFFEMGYARAVMTQEYKYIAIRYPPHIQTKIDRGEKFNGFYSPSAGIDERQALDYPYLIRNSHLGHHSSQQNPHYFELDQLYHLAEDSTEEINLLYDEDGLPIPEDLHPRQGGLTNSEKAKRQEMQYLLQLYLQSFPGRPFGDFFDG